MTMTILSKANRLSAQAQDHTFGL